MTPNEEALISVKLADALTVEFVRAYFIVYFTENEPWSGTERRIRDIVVYGKPHTQYTWVPSDIYLKQMLEAMKDDIYQSTTTYRALQMFAQMHRFVQENESQFINA